jgi:hypothetical protein
MQPLVLRRWLFDSLMQDGVAEEIDSLFKIDETGILLLEPPPVLPFPITEAVECELRRMHIEALAVSVCAIHMEEGGDEAEVREERDRSAASPEEKEQQAQLKRKVETMASADVCWRMLLAYAEVC